MTEAAPPSLDQRVRVVASLVADIKLDPALAERVGADTDLLADVGMDSLEITDLMLRLEDELGHEIDLDRIGPETLRSVGALCRAVAGS